MHGTSNLSHPVTPKVYAYQLGKRCRTLTALVAMRVHALHGGPKRLKLILWACGVVYALTTMALLGAGLYVRQRESLPSPFFFHVQKKLHRCHRKARITYIGVTFLADDLAPAPVFNSCYEEVRFPIISFSLLLFISSCTARLFPCLP